MREDTNSNDLQEIITQVIEEIKNETLGLASFKQQKGCRNYAALEFCKLLNYNCKKGDYNANCM